MSLGIRGKLFLLAVAAISLIVAIVGAYAEHRVRQTLVDNTRTELTRQARATGVVLERSTIEQVDEVADRMADATGIDVAIFELSGTPLGDSKLAPLELAQLVDRDRPAADEVRLAADEGVGIAVRTDPNGRDVMYAAVRVAAAQGAVIARASAPMVSLASTIRRLRGALVVAGILGVAVAGVLLVAVSSQVERALQPVVSTAAAMHAIEPSRDTDLDAPQSLRSVALDLERTMGMLAAERNRFEAVLQTMEQAVLVLDLEHRLINVNRAAGSLFSLPNSAAGRTLLEVIRAPRLTQLAEEAASGGIHRDEFDLPGGRRIKVRATEGGDGIVLVAQDVTSIRRLERVRRDFVANVSHELRTPISVIKANTETLLDGALDDAKMSRMFIEAIHRHADRLGRLVSDLLDISRIEAGRYPLDLTRLNVGETVDHVLDLVEVEAKQKSIDVSVAIEPNVEILSDRKAFEHVLINLATNAVKYTAEGGTVEVTAYITEAHKVRVCVLDDGPGIDPAHRERIFERFFRADSGRSRDMGGTGLGLSIVKHLVEAQQGEVGVDPRSPRGSVFWFELPAPDEARG